MNIRRANKNDFEEYYKLKADELRDEGDITGEKVKIPSKAALKKEFKEFLSKKGIFLVIEEGDGLIGYGNGMIYKRALDSKFHMWFLFVEKEYRGKGLGTKLIKDMIKFAKSKGVDKITLDVNPKNTPAFALYRNLGFDVDKYRMVLR
jgi:ribosomal protein S18 acetylase RimI-like enzyme